MEREKRRKNLVFKGVRGKEGDNRERVEKKECKELGVEIEIEEVQRERREGRREGRWQ